MLTKEEVLAARGRLKTETLAIPELGGEILVSELTSAEAETLDAANYPALPDGSVKYKVEGHEARWIIATVRDGYGAALFAPADEQAVRALPHSIARRIIEAAKRLNGAVPDAVEDVAKK